MSLGWARRVFGRNPQSVVDFSGDLLRHEDSLSSEAACGGPRDPSLPVDVSNCTGFQDLPDELLEHIFMKLAGTSRKNYFAVTGVSRSWRKLGHRMFFSSPWDTPHLICHPNQLFCLSPRTPTGSRSGLLKCFVRREPHSPRMSDVPGRRVSLYLGKDPQNPARARFLLCAVQCSGNQTAIYLNSRCEGSPCAVLTSNFLCTSYTLTLDSGMAFFLDRPSANSEGTCPGPTAAAATALGSSFTPARPVGSLAAAASELAGQEATGEIESSPASEGGDMGCEEASPAMPQLLLSLRYRARVKGLMQPRRMDAALPNPRFMACHRALPKVQITPGSPSTSYSTLGCGGSMSSTPVAAVRHRPSLGNISSLAVLERPPTFPVTPRSSVNGAGPSTSSPATPASPFSSSLSPAMTPDREDSPGASDALGATSSYDSYPVPTKPSVWKRMFSAGSRTRSGIRRAPGNLLKGGGRGPVTVDESALPVCLCNKAPHWNEALRCWCLNFRGRVKLASVKNFQLVKGGDPDAKVVMQFGKVEKDAFILDFNPTALSTIQAFAIALTTFDSKMTL